MNNNFTRQIKGFFLASLKMQSRNRLILALGFILPILMIFGFQFISNNNFAKIRVGIVRNDNSSFENVLTALNNDIKDGNGYYQIEQNSEQEINKMLNSNEIDVKISYIESGKTFVAVAKDNKTLRNKIVENTVNKAIYKLEMDKNSFKAKENIKKDIFTVGQGEFLNPIFPVLLAFSIVLCCISMSDLNIFNSKDNLALRRIFVAPTYPAAYFIGQTFARITFCIMQMTFVLAITMIFFGYTPLNLLLSLPQLLILIVITCIICISQNLILAAIIKKDKALNVVNASILFIQFLLVTDYLPVKTSLEFANLVNLLPLGAFTRATSYITTSGFTILSFEVLQSLIVLLVWLGTFVFITQRLFKLKS
jgi:ABC-type multidrug transport system permease subunit